MFPSSYLQPHNISKGSRTMGPWNMLWRRQWQPTPVLLPGKSHGGAWKAAVHGFAEGQTRLSDFTFTFHFHALEKEMATHSSVLAWRIPGTGEPGGLPSMGLHRVGHNWSDLAAAEYVEQETNHLLLIIALKKEMGFIASKRHTAPQCSQWHSDIICTCQDREATGVSINRWMSKEDIYTI